MGIDLEKKPEDWSFEIRRNVIVDQATLIDNLAKLQQLGIMDREEMVVRTRNVDYDQAIEIIKKIDENNNKAGIVPAIKAGAGVEGVNGANFQGGKVSGVKNPTADKGGRPNEKGQKDN